MSKKMSVVMESERVVIVDGVRVERLRTGWSVEASALQAIWEKAIAENPAQEGERLYVVTQPASGMSGKITRAQSNAYLKGVARLTNAARRATKPQRDAKRAARQAAAQRYQQTIVATAFCDLKRLS